MNEQTMTNASNETTGPSMTKEAWRAVAAAAEAYERKDRPCHICGAPGVYVGIFFPNQEFSIRIGAPKGKIRTVFYRLCEDCSQLPNGRELVEAGILRDLQVQ
jgi:hypothetical protein